MMLDQPLTVPPHLVEQMARMLCESKGENPYEQAVYYGPGMPGIPQYVLRWQVYVEDVMMYLNKRRLFEPFLQANGVPL